MDNLTHTLFGLALAKTGLERSTPRATAALLIGANFPDIDSVTLLNGSISYLKYHRGITHSIAGILVEALFLAAILVWVRGRSRPIRFERLYLMALIGMASHFLLDYTNSYGIRPFLPFDGRWVAGDLVFIIDPWMLLLLLSGLGLPFLFRLVLQEIGAQPSGYRAGAFGALALISGFWGAKWVSHEHALDELQQRTYSTGPPLRVGALPQFLNPFGWYGVVETDTAYHLTFAGWNPLRGDLARRRVRTLNKSDDANIVRSAIQGEQARIFMDFARYPLLQVNPAQEGYEVIARDLRFDFASRLRQGFLCTILLDRNLNVISERFRY